MIYLDNAATTAVKPEVFEQMMPYFMDTYSNPASVYSFAGKAKKAVDDAREQIANALNAEGKEILSKIPSGAKVFSMCIEGKQLSSERLAREIDSCGVLGFSNVVFIIGSSYGLSDEVKKRSDFRLSMSEMTFPHQLARIMLLEQIYRAFRINSGGKYHK